MIFYASPVDPQINEQSNKSKALLHYINKVTQYAQFKYFLSNINLLITAIIKTNNTKIKKHTIKTSSM